MKKIFSILILLVNVILVEKSQGINDRAAFEASFLTGQQNQESNQIEESTYKEMQKELSLCMALIEEKDETNQMLLDANEKKRKETKKLVDRIRELLHAAPEENIEEVIQEVINSWEIAHEMMGTAAEVFGSTDKEIKTLQKALNDNDVEVAKILFNEFKQRFIRFGEIHQKQIAALHEEEAISQAILEYKQNITFWEKWGSTVIGGVTCLAIPIIIDHIASRILVTRASYRELIVSILKRIWYSWKYPVVPITQAANQPLDAIKIGEEFLTLDGTPNGVPMVIVGES